MKYLLVILIPLLLAGCCDLCECLDREEGADALYFSFDQDTARNGFFPEELDSIYVIRDSLGQVKDTTFVEDEIQIGRTQSGYEKYNYRIVVVGEDSSYYVQNIQLNGERRQDKCCDCYYNTQKTFLVGDSLYDRKGTNLPVVLKK